MNYILNPKRRPLCGSQALQEAGAEDLRVLLCLSELGSATLPALAEATGMAEDAVRDALSFWRGAGVVARGSNPAAPQPLPPAAVTPPAPAAPAPTDAEMPLPPKALERDKSVFYQGDELAKRLDRYALRSLISACQQVVMRELGRTEMNVLVYLREQLNLQPDYVLMLLQYCVDLGHPSFAYMEKVAVSLVNQDITTSEALARYIERQQLYRSKEGIIRRMFGIGDRQPSSREKKLLSKWLTDFGYDENIIGLAYDMTVNNTGKASMPYADKLLSDWHLSGCKTTAQAEAQAEKERLARIGATAGSTGRGGTGKTAPGKPRRPMSFDPDEALQKALERSYGDVPDEKK